MTGSAYLPGLDLEALAREHGTPLYLYDMDAALEHLRAFRRNLPDGVDVLYCAKANPNHAVLEAFRPEVAGLDISSAGELDLGERAGFAPSGMSFAGPGKGPAELERAIGAGLGLLSVESLAEIERAGTIASRLGRTQAVTLRLNPMHAAREFAMKMGGGPSQFGVAEEDAGPAIELIRRTPGLRLVGVHVFAGTQCLEADALLGNLEQTLDIAARLAVEHSLSLEVVNLGGGFGVPYFAGQEDLDVDALSRRVGALLSETRGARPALARTRFILEFGRFLIGAFGIYLARVLDLKQTRGRRYVILDGGMNHCFPATGMFGQLIKKNYPVRNLTRPDGPALAQELVGPLCTPMDTLARAIELPEARVGDLIAFLHSGAYSFSASPLLFLGHDTPIELVLARGRVLIGRERKSATIFA